MKTRTSYLKASLPKMQKAMKTVLVIGSVACHPTILRAIKQEHGVIVSPYDKIGLNGS